MYKYTRPKISLNKKELRICGIFCNSKVTYVRSLNRSTEYFVIEIADMKVRQEICGPRTVPYITDAIRRPRISVEINFARSAIYVFVATVEA